MTSTTDMTSTTTGTIDVVNEMISSLVNMVLPLFIIALVLGAVAFILKTMMYASEGRSYYSSGKPLALVPSKAIRKMLYEIDGEGMPSWVKKLEKYEGIEIQDAKVKKAIAKLEGVFQKEITKYNENFTEFKKLSKLDDDEQNIVSELAGRLAKQKELLMEMGQEILSLRVQEDVANRTSKAQELTKKMDKELSNQTVTEHVRNTARSVEEQVLQDILSSKEASNDMKERAKELLPHFKGKSKEEQQQEMKRQDFELDLQTLEKIVVGRVNLDEKEEI